MKKYLFAAVVLSTLAGCASVPMGTPEQDASAKKFSAPAGKTGLYVYRNDSMGGAVTMHVGLDNAPLGDTGGHTYLYKEVAPGKHTITSDAENTDTLEVDAKPGTDLYVWQEVKMGVLKARSKLHLMGEADGQEGVRACKLAETK